MFHDQIIYIIGDAQVSQNNPISKQYNQFFLGIAIDRSNGIIVEVDCSATVQLTVKFIASIMVNRSIHDDQIIEHLQNRYHGSSQKALIVAFKDVQRKYNQITALPTMS
ncbi:hypothetical protein DCE79_14860 [Lysinibacillus sp. 2017]|uniref:DUF3870 domain-containing protein n=1 Tax=unclassified Lysinibacillus TaxID=2636778 RepID=UPI000D526A48|nr:MULTISPECIES: DUF3870 domain-containing protein [unclassified Lysinibacillus]AWE08570.1 hypothetical protein DCE79_14860 [Lysinibacillus sp. 2017]TGN35660.1 DUF3870 domain-containing protein [Lysinibacillus sp. S2017]